MNLSETKLTFDAVLNSVKNLLVFIF